MQYQHSFTNSERRKKLYTTDYNTESPRSSQAHLILSDIRSFKYKWGCGLFIYPATSPEHGAVPPSLQYVSEVTRRVLTYNTSWNSEIRFLLFQHFYCGSWSCLLFVFSASTCSWFSVPIVFVFEPVPIYTFSKSAHRVGQP